MPTTYTPRLKFALPATGELSGTWGDVVNNNITSIIEQAIAGLATINTWTANSKTLTVNDGTPDEARCAMLVFATGAGGTALTAAGTVICPAVTKLYIAKNSSAFPVTLRTASGTGISVPVGQTMVLMCDGTNVVSAASSLVGGPSWTAANVPGTSIDVSSAFYFSKTISANTTFTVTNVPPSGTLAYFFLELTNGGAFSTAFWSGVRWADDIPIALAQSGTDLLEFSTRDGGVTWLARKVGNYNTWTKVSTLNNAGRTFGGANNILYIGADANGLFALGEFAQTVAYANATPGAVQRTGGWSYSSALVDMFGSNTNLFSSIQPTPVVITNGQTSVTFSTIGRVLVKDGVSWTTNTALSGTAWGAAAVFSGAFGAARYVVGGSAGKIAYSSDTLTWTNGTSLSGTAFGTGQNVVGMAFGNSVFVALGSNGGVGTSADGITWTYQAGLLTAWTSGTGVDVVFANGIFMAIGLAGKLATSTDGVTWTNQAALAASAWGTSTTLRNCLIYTGTAWAAVSTNPGGTVATSTDNGVTWTTSTTLSTLLGGSTPATFFNILGLCRITSGTLAAYGGGGMFAYSGDNGATWSVHDGPAGLFTTLPAFPGPTTSYNSIITALWANSQFLISSGWAVATSPDGVNWTTRTNGLRTRFNASQGTNAWIRGTAFGNSTYVVVGQSSRVFTSTDNGVTWTYQNDYNSKVTNAPISGVAFGNGVFVLIANASRRAVSSDNGVTWTTGTIPWGSIQGNGIIFGNGIFLAIGSSARVATSSDGVTWTDRTANLSGTTWGATNAVWSAVFANSQFVIGGANGVVATSPDGATWTYRGGLISAWAPYGTVSAVSYMGWTGSEYIATAGALAATSPDGITWTDISGQLPSSVTLPIIFSGSYGPVASNGTTAIMGGTAGTLFVR